jgi:hypothetical protein
MINEWLECKEFMRLANVSKSSVDRLKREVKLTIPEKLKFEDGKQKLHKDLLRKYSSDYYVDFHNMVNYQLNLGKSINSINTIWGLYLLSKEWSLIGTLNYQSEIHSRTCIDRFKRIFNDLKDIYPKIEGFYATEKNNDRKGSHLHFIIKTKKENVEVVKDSLKKIKFPSNKTLEVEYYQQSKFGTSYLTKVLTNNPDGYGFL